jgi:hypothetical protein
MSEQKKSAAKNLFDTFMFRPKADRPVDISRTQRLAEEGRQAEAGLTLFKKSKNAKLK